MRQITLPRLLTIPAVMGLVLVAGCGARTVSVSGTLLVPSNVKVESKDSVNISFVPEGEGKAASGVLDETDKTKFVAKDIVPGKYKVVVMISPYMGEKDSAKRQGAFLNLNKRFSREETPLKYEVTADPQQSITVNLDTLGVTKS